MVKWVIMKRFSSDHEQIRRFQPGNLHFGGRFLDDHPKLVVILFFRRPFDIFFVDII